jgi:ATP phosphoribosyltransferase
MQIKLALPKGRLLPWTNLLLQRSGLELSGYNEHSRSYRPQCGNFPDLFLKIFHERDIPIQVAVGNYDLGICGLDWVEELLAKYPSSALVKVRDLGYGESDLCVAVSKSARVASMEELRSEVETIRIATEYPNLAESFALRLRLRRFNVFPLWGAAEVYPPESAELALLSQTHDSPFDQELIPLASIRYSSAFLIAHQPSWECKDLSSLLHRLYAVGDIGEEVGEGLKSQGCVTRELSSSSQSQNSDLWLALPDGHQQKPALEFLRKASIRVEGQFAKSRRPTISLEGVKVKVIRPQDMPLQVANGNFDLAITGQDWLYDHLCRFPSSPVKEILDLGFGKVRVVAVVSGKLPVDSPQDLRGLLGRGSLTTLRVASEYTNIADKYARDNHLSPYRLIPTWGASEAFLPEDADLLIENVQTGRTLAQHNLKIIDTLFESSACLIGNAHVPEESSKQGRMDYVVQILRQAAKEK